MMPKNSASTSQLIDIPINISAERPLLAQFDILCFNSSLSVWVELVLGLSITDTPSRFAKLCLS